ncbi:MAG TPA: hypothetical protein VFH68_05460 [Polyangia bacterium]|nr:hypothetical protein [Polyangia bacterium]
MKYPPRPAPARQPTSPGGGPMYCVPWVTSDGRSTPKMGASASHRSFQRPGQLDRENLG